jgi:hypothetical protein
VGRHRFVALPKFTDSGRGAVIIVQHAAHAPAPLDHACVSKVARFWADESALVRNPSLSPAIGPVRRTFDFPDRTRFFSPGFEEARLNPLDDVFLQNLTFEVRSAFSKVSPSWMCFFRYGH